MPENEVISDLGDIRMKLIDILDNISCVDVNKLDEINGMIELVDKKIEKYRGKEVVINVR